MAKTFGSSVRLASANTEAPESFPSFLPHQERVNIEMFKAIETLGRKLEKAEEERDRLARRLALIESSTEVDAATGRLYLPAVIGAPVADRAAVAAALPKWPVALSVFSGAVAFFALAVVAIREPAPVLTPKQIAALNALELASAPAKFEPAASSPALKQPEAAPPVVQDAPKPIEPAREVPEVPAVPVIAPIEDAALSPIPEVKMPPAEQEEPTTPAPEKAPEVAAKPVEKEKPVEKQAKAAEKPQAPQPAKAEPVKEVAVEADDRLPRQFQDLEKKAFSGVAEAQHDLATLYASGKTIPQDYKRAVYWFSKAADGNVPNAHYNLGVMFQQGLGVKRDLGKALGWYQRAASMGHPEALYNLGIAYIEGVGAQRDLKKGVAYFKSAANAGVAQAAFNLGILYESNFLGPIDLDKALEWYSVAEDQGHAEAGKAVKRLKAQIAEMGGPSTLAASDMADPQSAEEEGEGDSSPPAKAVSKRAASSSDALILKIQKALVERALLPRDAATGQKDARTEDAIRAWQRKKGMTTDGQASQALLDSLKAGG